MTVERAIWRAIRARIETLPMPYAKAWPAETFTPPQDNGLPAPYLRIGRVSAAPARMMIANGSHHNRSGSVTITLVHPLNREWDASMYDQTAGAIAAHFADGTCMAFGGVSVSVPNYPHVQEGYEDNGYWNVPVVIPWRIFA